MKAKKRMVTVLVWEKRPLQSLIFLVHFMVLMGIGQLILMITFSSFLPVVLYFMAFLFAELFAEYKFKIIKVKR